MTCDLKPSLSGLNKSFTYDILGSFTHEDGALSAAPDAVVAGDAPGDDPLPVGQAGRGRECHVLVEQDVVEIWLQKRPAV